jgi:hypothetical protein
MLFVDRDQIVRLESKFLSAGGESAIGCTGEIPIVFSWLERHSNPSRRTPGETPPMPMQNVPARSARKRKSRTVTPGT